VDSLLLRRRVLTLVCRSESDLGFRVGTAMATLVMDMAIIRMGIIDRIRTTMRGLHSTGPAGIESITATIVIIAIGTKMT
jgi:hypothetical protein